MTESEFPTFEAVSALVVVLELDGRVVYWNRACSELTGYSLEEVRGGRFWDLLLVPEEVEAARTAFAELLVAAHPSSFANHWVTKLGARRWIAWSNTVTNQPDGRVQYVIGTGIDRTDRKGAEDALRASEAKLDGIIRIAAEAIVSIDNEQRIVMYNQGAEKIFGWSAAEVMGKPLNILLPERLRDVHGQQVHAFGSGDPTARQMGQRRPAIFGLRKSGEEFPAQAAISKLDVGGTWLFTVVLRDVTEQEQRKKEQAALAIENARLYESSLRAANDLREANEHLVGATIREQELKDDAEAARARLEDSERELRELGEFRELFIGILGHDLRNPLGAIDMAAALLRQRGHLDEQDEKTVARIIKSSQRMTRMISQLLDLTRARLGGGFLLELKTTNLGSVCHRVVEEFEAAIQLKVESDVIGFWDPDRLEEVFSNLVGNAIDHASTGTAVVVKAQSEGAEVVVEISNQGDPIPPDVLPFIFDPFRRAKQRERSATGNLGLGLYIAKQIVLAHGGTIAVESSSERTTFVVRLPSAHREDWARNGYSSLESSAVSQHR